MRVLLFIRIVTGKDQLERATRRMVSKSEVGNVWNWKNVSKPLIELNRLKATCKWTQQLQPCCDLQCIVGRIQPISLCKPCIMSMCGPNNVGRGVQTNPTLLRYASAITEQKKCWELLTEKFDWFQTLRLQQDAATCNRLWKWTQHVTSINFGSCWPTMLRPFARA